MLFRFSYVWRLRFTARQPQQTPGFYGLVEIEAERGELVTAFRRDLVHGPTRLPCPVDAEFLDETGEGAGAFVLDQVGQRAGRRGERHRDDGSAQFVDFDAVNQTKVDDVDAEFRVDDLVQGFFHVSCRGTSDIVDGFQRNVVILRLGASARVGMIAAAANVLPVFFGFLVHRLAVLEPFGQVRIEHDATGRVLIVAQGLGHGIEDRRLRFGYQGVAHCLSKLLMDVACIC